MSAVALINFMSIRESNRLGSGKMPVTDRIIAVEKRRADKVVQEWADLGDRFVFYALGNSRAEYDDRLAKQGVFQPNFKFEALFRKALELNPQRAFDVISEMQGDSEILARCKALAFEAVKELELQGERGENRGWVRQAVAGALGSLASLANFAD